MCIRDSFCRSVVALSGIELTTIERDRFFVLANYSAQLGLASVCVYNKRLVELRVREKRFASDDFLHGVERFCVLRCPFPLSGFGRELCQGSKEMRASDPHISVVHQAVQI